VVRDGRMIDARVPSYRALDGLFGKDRIRG